MYNMNGKLAFLQVTRKYYTSNYDKATFSSHNPLIIGLFKHALDQFTRCQNVIFKLFQQTSKLNLAMTKPTVEKCTSVEYSSSSGGNEEN